MKKMMAVALAGLLVSTSAMAVEINDNLSIGATIEVEASVVDGDENTNDISLATGELTVDGKIREGISGHLLYCWNDEDDAFTMDEIYMTLEKDALYSHIGKQVVPFGRNETAMVSDPLTLSLSETHETGITVGWAEGGFDVYGFAYNASLDEEGEDDQTRSFGFGAGYETGVGPVDLVLGAQYVSRMSADEFSDSVTGIGDVTDIPAAAAAHVEIGIENFALRAEGVLALGDIDFKDTTNASIEDVAAYAVEGAFTRELFGRETTLAVGYQWSDNAEDIEEMPEERILATVGVGLAEGLGLAIEYAHDEAYGTADDEDALVAQLALEF